MADRLVSVVSKAPVVVAPTNSAAMARATAEAHRVHHLVVEDGERLVGTVCRCDLDRAFQDDTVARHMRKPAFTLPTDTTSEAAAVSMLRESDGCLILLSATGKPDGLVTREDLQRAGVLPGERGVDCCAACGACHCRLMTNSPGEPVLCSDCLDQVRERGARGLYYTLGGGD